MNINNAAMKIGITHPFRRNTLFELKAYPEYKSTYLKPPKLTVINCEFENFYNNYDSLINVDTNDFRHLNFS